MANLQPLSVASGDFPVHVGQMSVYAKFFQSYSSMSCLDFSAVFSRSLPFSFYGTFAFSRTLKTLPCFWLLSQATSAGLFPQSSYLNLVSLNNFVFSHSFFHSSYHFLIHYNFTYLSVSPRWNSVLGGQGLLLIAVSLVSRTVSGTQYVQ